MMSSEEHIAQLANQFAEDGYCLMENFMAPELIENWKSHSLTAFSEVMELIKIGNESFGIGVKNGFKEIVQRHPLRYEMPFGANDEKFDIVLQNTQLLTLVRKILQSDDVIIANRSFVISQPGAEVQGWHSDGPHVSITDYLPCHVLNVFIPLVNIDESNGPTEFRPGSQKYTNNLAKGLLLAKARKTSKPVQSPSINIGSALLVGTCSIQFFILVAQR